MKKVEDKCQSLIKKGDDVYVPCTNLGKERYDNGLYSGIHCDSCWEQMVSECRKRSW